MLRVKATPNDQVSTLWILASSLILIVPFVAASSAHAGYTPPPKKSIPSGPMTLTGRRGECYRGAKTALTALAPQTHVGQSISTHPIFTWHVPDGHRVPLEFHLYKRVNDKKVAVFKTVRQSQPGFMSQQLPVTQPALTVGDRYQWQVVTLCNPDRPSSALIVDAEVDLVAPPPSLSPQLSRQPLGMTTLV